MQRRVVPARRQRGVALVETVLVSPLLLFLLVVGAEVTNAWIDHNTLTKSARNGVRHLASTAVQGTQGVVVLTPLVVSQTRNLVVFGNAIGSGSPVLPGLAIGNVLVQDLGDNNIQVSVSYAYNGILGNSLPSFGFGSDNNLALNLQATVSMRAL